MATRSDKKDVFLKGVFTQAVAGARPIKFKTYQLPEYFYCTVYLFDSDGKKVTKATENNFKVWSVEFLIRVSTPDTLETITTTIKGASAYKGHTVVSFGLDEIKEFSKLGKVKPSYYKSVSEYRARFMGWVITSAVQSLIYKKGKDGSHGWPIGGRRVIDETELQVIATGVINSAYLTLDDAFYKEVARIYKKAKADGEWPNEVLKQVYDRTSTKTVQGWHNEATKRGYLTEKDKGVSTVRKTARKKSTERKGK
jgi:hypothetical protein